MVLPENGKGAVMPEHDERGRATVRVRQTDEGPAVEIGLPAHTSLDAVLVNPDLIGAIRGIRPGRGCEACHSGVPLYIVEEFEEVVLVDLGD
jgi:hypothetical protein